MLKGSYQEFIFEEEGFFEISKNKFPSRYTVVELTELVAECTLPFELYHQNTLVLKVGMSCGAFKKLVYSIALTIITLHLFKSFIASVLKYN